MTAFDKKEFLHRSMMAGSHNRAAVLAELAEIDVPDSVVREILVREWPVVDGSREFTPVLLDLFRRAGYTTDEPEFVIPTDEDGDVEIFRGNVGEDPRLGFSWTLDRKRAEFFASAPFSLRHQILGISASRVDGEEPIASVWGAWINEADILGYFGGRGEQEVIIDPDFLIGDPVLVAQAVPA